jgi:drug/metabolite transporter (DMT)-like permease
MTLKSPKSLTADILLIIATLFWGTSFVVVKELVAIIPFQQLILLRFGISAIIIFPFVYPQIRQQTKSVILPSVWLGFTIFAGFTFQTWSMKYTTATQAAFLTGVSVILVPVFLFLLRHTVASFKLWICVILALIGLGLLCLNSQWQLGYGDMLAAFCAVAFAFHIIYTSLYTQKYQPLFILWIQFIAVLIYGGLAYPIIFPEPWIHLTGRQWLGVGYLVLFPTIGCYITQVYFQKLTDTTRAALIYTLEPVFAAVISYFMINEMLTTRQWIGAILIFSAMVLSELKRKSNE